MTPQEKGLELFNKIAKIIDESHRDDLPKRTTKHKAKACAIIAIELVIDLPCIWISEKLAYEFGTPEESLEYWEQVKEEIQKL